MADFASLLQNGETALLAAVRRIARGQDHYLAAVDEVWNLAFQGLTSTLRAAVAAGSILEPQADLEGRPDPVAEYGRLEAKRHRERGVSLEMFLGLLKVFRAAYLEVLRDGLPDGPGRASAVQQLLRFFDRIEISFCLAWVREAEAGGVRELQDRNLELVIERDRYVAIFESLPMPILLLNPDQSIRNLNHAAYRLFCGQGSPGAYYYASGQRPRPSVLTDLFPDFFVRLEAFLALPEGRSEQEWTASRDGVALHFRVVISRMLDQAAPFAGILVALDDQTERVAAARERERMLTELTAALAEVRNLSTLLPICAWCKKIRDDKGYWDQLEGYFAAHTGIVFSHGMCPECAAKFRDERR